MVPSLLRCSFEHLADASGTALKRLGTASVLISSTSDTFTRKLSEVQCFSRVPPTLLQGNRRRSNAFRGYLRHFYKETVGGPMFFEGTSDTFTRKLSEVQCFSRVSPTLLPGNCRRSCGYKNQEGGFGGDFVFGVSGF